jgi:hypothetical protein
VAAAPSHGRVPPAEKGDDKFIRSAQPGGWRDNLTPAEQRIMHEVMGAKLVELGYATPETLPV